jgi:hypothetical protein
MAKILGTFFLLLAAMFMLNILTVEGGNKMDKYEWLPTESSFENFPMRIVAGDFIFNDGTSIYIPSSKIIYNGWGVIGSTHIVGDKLKPLPAKIKISWFSFAEDKFYSGAFTLPYDKITILFKKGFQSPINKKWTTYERIIVGMAPAGEMSIWLMGDGEVLLVSSFKAQETIIDWKYVTENTEFTRKTYITRVLNSSLSKDQISELSSHGVPYELLDAYRKQYSWKPEVIGSKPTHLWLKTYNGECEFIDFVQSDVNHRTLRSVPKHIDIEWLDRFGKIYRGNITFDEKEVLQAYKKISAKQEGHEMKLQIEINEKTSDINLSLKDSKYILRLSKSVVKMYER